MNLFTPPKRIEFDESQLSLVQLHGLTWLEKDWYWREQARLKQKSITGLNQTAQAIAEQAEISVSEAIALLKTPNPSGINEKLIEFTDLIVNLQSENSIAQLESDYRFVGMILSARLSDSWLEQNLTQIRSHFLSDMEGWEPNLTAEEIWTKINCPIAVRTQDPFRLNSFTQFCKKMPPDLFSALLDFCEAEISGGDSREEGGGAAKKNTAPPKSSTSETENQSISPSAA